MMAGTSHREKLPAADQSVHEGSTPMKCRRVWPYEVCGSLGPGHRGMLRSQSCPHPQFV